MTRANFCECADIVICIVLRKPPPRCLLEPFVPLQMGNARWAPKICYVGTLSTFCGCLAAESAYCPVPPNLYANEGEIHFCDKDNFIQKLATLQTDYT
jgi:hypothetical protein